MHKFVSALLALFAVAALAGERPDPKVPQGENMKLPTGWKVILDKPKEGVVIGDAKDADIYFVNMTPGWHITTGPAAILYHPDNTATGEYRLESVIHLFDTKGRNEAFGVIFGGKDLESDARAYDYFVIRNSGEFLIKRREGAKTSVIQDWTRHEAMKRWAEGEGSAKNLLAVGVGKDAVDFYINDAKVATLPRASVSTDGIVGLRVNHQVNLHVSDLSVK